MSKAALAPQEKAVTTAPTSSRNPFELMRTLTSDMDRWFNDLRTGGPRALINWPSFGADVAFTPEIEVQAQDGKLVVRADLPGLTKDNVTVDVTDEVLTIKGERKHEEEKKGEGYYHSERSYGRFCRNIALPDGVKPETATATFKDGVLQVTVDVPTQKAPEPRHVAIS